MSRRRCGAARGLALLDFDEDRLRGREMGEAASVVAAIPAVRAALIDMQRAFAGRAQGAVLDGRDIGTVIAPEATVKIFVTASPEARAQRRALELRGRGEKVDYAAILDDIKKRDKRDSERVLAPLKPAADAHVLDTTDMNIEAAFAAALEHSPSRRGAHRSRPFCLVNCPPRLAMTPTSRGGALRVLVGKTAPARRPAPARNQIGGASRKRCALAERSPLTPTQDRRRPTRAF